MSNLLTASNLSIMLAQDVERVCLHLCNKFKKAGNEMKLGSTKGEAGESLSVHLSGTKAGVWADFATNESGDLLDLWSAIKGIRLYEAMQEAKQFLAIPSQSFVPQEQKVYKRPD